MCVISKLAKTERKQQDSSVRRATKRDRMTKVTRIRGPIWTHASALTNAVEAESANHLIARQNQATLWSYGNPLGECRFYRPVQIQAGSHQSP